MVLKHIVFANHAGVHRHCSEFSHCNLTLQKVKSLHSDQITTLSPMLQPDIICEKCHILFRFPISQPSSTGLFSCKIIHCLQTLKVCDQSVVILCIYEEKSNTLLVMYSSCSSSTLYAWAKKVHMPKVVGYRKIAA